MAVDISLILDKFILGPISLQCNVTGSSKSTSGCPQEVPFPDRLPAHVPDFFVSQIEHLRPQFFSVDNPTHTQLDSYQ